jgi:hypothetical protein
MKYVQTYHVLLYIRTHHAPPAHLNLKKNDLQKNLDSQKNDKMTANIVQTLIFN